nr:CPBP family intramembrane glutamic endopeptidase [Pseudoxanthomonas koreensis]
MAATAAPARVPRLPPARWRSLLGGFLLDVLLAVLVMFAALLLAGIAWGLWRGIALARDGADSAAITAALGTPGALAQIVMTLAGMSAVALTLYFLRHPASAEERRHSVARLRLPSTWAWAAAVGLAVFLGSSLLGWLAGKAGIEAEPTNLALIDQALQQWPLFLVLFAVVLAPAYEELLFRRVLFGRFLAGGRPWAGLVLSSLAFALIHELPGASANPPLAVAYLLLVYAGMGAAFAWLYWRTGTLWAPVLAHGLNNAVALAFHVFG